MHFKVRLRQIYLERTKSNITFKTHIKMLLDNLPKLPKDFVKDPKGKMPLTAKIPTNLYKFTLAYKNKIPISTSLFVPGLLEDYFRGNLVFVDKLPPSPDQLLADIGILQNEAQHLKDHILAQNEVINHLQNSTQSSQNSNHTYLHQNLGGNTMVLPKTEGAPIGEPEKIIPKPMGEPHPKPTDVLQLGLPETLPKPFLQYNQNLQQQNKEFSQEEKNELLEKIQELENEILNILNENSNYSDIEDSDEELDLETYKVAVYKMLDFTIKNIEVQYNIEFRKEDLIEIIDFYLKNPKA